jgi:hypothetical protein
LRRSRVVPEDWLVAIDANRYSVPWRLIGETVEVVRVGALWQITYQGQIVAEHEVLSGRHQLSVQTAHGPGAVARKVRTRFADTAATIGSSSAVPALLGVEVRDLDVYERQLEVA